CHPSTLVGVPVIFYSKPRVPPLTRLHSGLWLYRPPGSKFRYADAPQATLQIPIYRDAGGFFLNGVDISIAYKIFGTHVVKL
ncbi:MAG: hypothetical protein J6J97_09725, partial [Akkermansia sp.]|nr:hypothetical protein [Akkermansia sp.]